MEKRPVLPKVKPLMLFSHALKKRVCFLTLAFIFLMTFASAEIVLNQPLETYNLGDKLYVSAEGVKGVSEGNLNLDLVCGNNTVNLERMSARRYDSEEAYTYELPYKFLTMEDLELGNLSSIVGTCQVILSVGAQSAATGPFVISDSVGVTATLDKDSYDPGEAITITIDAVKFNGKQLNGFVEASNGTVFSKAVEEGHAVETFSTVETLEAGTYAVDIVAYDVGSSGVLNKGTSRVYYTINAVPSFIVLSLSGESITPGEVFTVGAEVYDQAGKAIDGSVDVKMTSPEGDVFVMAINGGDFAEQSLDLNATAGTWKMQASFDGVTEERDVTVLEMQKADFEFQDSILIIRNVGNVRYNRTINLQIGNETKELVLNMDLGEERKFNMEAPEGEYEVLVNDGEASVSRNVLLTGNAISVRDLDSGIFKEYAFVWVFLILILAGTGIVLITRFHKTKIIGEKSKKDKIIGKLKSLTSRVKVPKKMKTRINNSLHFTNRSPSSQSLDPKIHEEDHNKIVDLTQKRTVKDAESTLVLNGEKSVSSVVAISVKNYEGMSENAKESLKEMVDTAKQNKGLVDWRGEYIFLVFSPLVTRTYHNENLAAKTAFEVLNKLKKYNRKFTNKIEFNIGVHSGELISSKEGGKLKYTTVGNTISFAKRLANSTSGKAIVSEEIRKKMLRDLKVKKVGDISGNPVYEIFEIKNKEANEAKLKDLLKRMD